MCGRMLRGGSGSDPRRARADGVGGHPPLSATPTSPPQGGRLAAGGIAGLRGDGGEAEDGWTLEDFRRRRIVGLEDMDDGRKFW